MEQRALTRSMTGFGRADVESSIGKFSCEVHSVNRRNLETTASFPREFTFLEPLIKKNIGKVCFRGQVHLRLNFEEVSLTKVSSSTLVNIEKELKDAAKKLGDYTLLFDTVVQVALRESSQGLLINRDEIEAVVSQGFERATSLWIEVKEEEGRSLQLDLKNRQEQVKKELFEIQDLPKESVKAYEERLKQKISELSTISSVDETRIQKEIVLFADRCDTTEEIVRLISHIDQFDHLLKSKELSKGKEMEFLLQEMMREMTTLTSKSIDLPITYKALNIKSHLEKMRQQVLNIE